MSFSTIAQSAKTGVNNAQGFLDGSNSAVLRPKSAEGIGGFVFDIPDNESVQLQSDITDHYTESNSFLNDHIVRKPIILTLSGFVGELVYRSPAGVEGAVQELNNRLETVEAYAGDLTPGGVQIAGRVLGQAQSAISAINQTLDKTENVIGLFDGEVAGLTLQQKAYNSLFSLWKEYSIVTVQTPWQFFRSMAIQSVSFTQNAESKEITDISVTLKEMRIADVKSVNFDQDQFPPSVQVQESSEEDQGIVRGEDKNESFLFSAFGGQ
jgi:hypothetical protein